MKTESIVVVILSVMVLSCATAPKKGVTREKLTPQSYGYTGTLLPAFYYTEGIKEELLYGNPVGSVKFFDRAIGIDSTHAPSYYQAAGALAGNDPLRALEYSRKAVRIDTANLWYRNQYGQLLLMTGDYDGALAIYENLVRESPHNPDNYRLLAALYEQREQPFTAIAVLDSAEYRLGRIEELAAYKRQLLIQVKLFDRAIEESKALVRDFPFREENYVVLGQLYAAAGKDSLAQANFDEALSLNPTSVATLGALNDFYKDQGDYANLLATAYQLFLSDEIPLDMKIDYFRELTRDRAFYANYVLKISNLAQTLLIKYPDSLPVLELYAGHLLAMGNTEEALALYKSELHKPQKDIGVFNTILDIEGYLKRPDSVSKYLVMALESFPDNAALYMRYGWILSSMEEPKKAQSAYEKALKFADNDSLKSIIYGTMGDLAYREDEKSKKSFTYYRRALKHDPENAMVLNNYSYHLSTSDRELEKSLEMARRATELTPNFSTYIDTYAWALYKLGRFEEAKKAMQQALSLDRSGSTELMIHYGDVLYALKEYFMASVYWKKALDAGHDAEEIAERFKWIEGK